MKKSYIIIILSIFLSGVLLAGLLLLLRPNDSAGKAPEETAEKTVYIEDAAALYAQAIEGLEDRELQLSVTESRVITNADTSYKAQSSYTLCLDRADAENPDYQMKGETVMGSHRINWEQYRIDNERYTIISGLAFRTVTEPGCELSYYIDTSPAAILDHTLYGSVIATETENGFCVEFLEASELESWLGNDHDHIEYIKATALLSKDKQLLSYSYATAYHSGTQRIEVSCSVTAEPMEITITLPEPEDGWLPLSLTGEPMRLEIAAGILVQATGISSQYHEEIYFEALGDRRVREISLWLDNREALSAGFITKTTTTKDSRQDQPEITVKEETFAENKYTVGQDGSEGNFDPSVDADAMLRYLQNQLLSTIMLPEYILECKQETVGSNIRYTFIGNNAFADFLCRNAGQQLYGDPQLLNGETVSIKTDQLSCYLEISADTGLPIGSGISFSGNYEMQGLPYQFIYQVSQTYAYDTP